MRICFLFLLLIGISSVAFALDPSVIWDSSEGLHRLQSSEAKANLWKLLRYYESQIRPAYCSVASSVMALNVLSVAPPPSKYLGRYRMFTQEEFFSEEVAGVIDPEAVKERGMALDELANVLETFPIHVTKFEAQELSEQEIRSSMISALQQSNQCVLALYQRRELEQDGGGHWSPVAAYDAASDSFLILDVARYKYPPVWIDATHFIQAMQTSNIYGRSRGYLVMEIYEELLHK
ncbi:MAG: phytochelatin synthase family protein [Parachlamydia sp.]|nr:phytochelatin synthase family protein [Parachlamydia sp.]